MLFVSGTFSKWFCQAVSMEINSEPPPRARATLVRQDFLIRRRGNRTATARRTAPTRSTRYWIPRILSFFPFPADLPLLRRRALSLEQSLLRLADGEARRKVSPIRI